MSVQDRIERVLTLRAPRARVWKAITEPAGLSQWLGNRAEVDLRPGGELILEWPEHGIYRCRIVTVEPPHRFAYRWYMTGMNSEEAVETGPSTLVEFSLKEVPEGTMLTLVESGFAAFPADIAAKSYHHSVEGWAIELGELAAYLETAFAPTERA